MVHTGHTNNHDFLSNESEEETFNSRRLLFAYDGQREEYWQTYQKLLVYDSPYNMTDYINPYFVQALKKNPENRNLQDLQIIYYNLQRIESFVAYHDNTLRALSRTVRYEKHEANDVLYSTGELATCWYVLLSGSVFINGCMFLPPNCIGQRTAGLSRRPNECFVLELSEMIVIDYSEMQTAHPSCTQRSTYRMDYRGLNMMFDDPTSNRDSQSSDTSSAYSGSDTISSIQSMDPEELDLSGLMESAVDSDEDDITENQCITERDKVRECLEKDPSERTDEDIEVLLEFTQQLKAFTNITLSIRRALCSVMVFAIVENAGTTVMNNGEELDSWSVIINGQVEIEHCNGTIENLKCGDRYGYFNYEVWHSYCVNLRLLNYNRPTVKRLSRSQDESVDDVILWEE